MASKKPGEPRPVGKGSKAKISSAKKEPAKKPAENKNEKPKTEELPISKIKTATMESMASSHYDLNLLDLPEEDKAILEKIKLTVDAKIDELIAEALGVLNVIIPRTYEYTPDGELLIDARTGAPKQDWSRITIGDIKAVLLKISTVQFTISSLEVDSWAEAELAKTLKEEAYAKAYESTKLGGTETARKNYATLDSMTDEYRAFYLKYANKRISTLNEGLSRITDKWSRAIELFKIEAGISGSANRF